MAEEEQGKELKEYIKTHPQLFVYLVLAIIILIGFTTRLQNIELLKDVTTGQYISLELDSEIFLRYAEYIAENGTLYSVDSMRFYPVGFDLSIIGTGVSYFVAYLYKFLHFFNSSITVQYADLLYPPIAMAIMSLFFFLLIRKLLNWKTALLTTLIIQFIPSFLFRSVTSDHDMLALMLIIITFYLYVTAWQSKTIKNRIIFGLSSALTTIFAGETGGSSSFIFLILGSFAIVEILLNKFENEDYYVYMCWLIPISIYQTAQGHLKGTLMSLMGMIPYLAFSIATAQYIIFKKKLLNLNEKLKSINLPENITSLIIILILGITTFIIFFGPGFITDKISELKGILFHSFRSSRWVMTVAENKTPYVVEWFGQLGRIITFSMIAGSMLLFYKAVKEIDKKKYLTITYGIFISLYIFSRYAPDSIFNGTSTLSKFTFYGSFVAFAIIIAYSYLNAYYKDKTTYEYIKTIDKKYAFLLIWFILSIVAATSAIRLIFEFTPIAVILASFFIVEVFDYFNTRKEQLLRWSGIIIIMLLLFSPFSFAQGKIQQGSIYQDYKSADNQMKYMGPGYNQQWQVAGGWARKNTPVNSVFAHWWDYGYWVQSGFDRTTVLDGANIIMWWNYLMGRVVLTGQTQEEALPFLFAHNVSYLLMIQDEIGKYTAYSSIGSDEKHDRFSWITTFGLNEQMTKETRNGTTLVYQGGFPLDEDFIYKGVVYPAGQAGIVAIKIPIINKQQVNSTAYDVKQPTILLGYQNQGVELKLKCVYFNNQLYEFENAEYNGCFRVIPTITNPQQVNGIGAGYFLSRRTYHSNFGQLYMLNKQSDYFKIAYDDSQNFPLAIYQGRPIGPTKIWKITYPENYSLTKEQLEYNLRRTYPNTALEKPK